MAKPARVLTIRGEWTQPEFAAIALALHETTGLVFPPNRRESAESGMRRAMAAACISDPTELLRAIRAAGEVRDILITELTIGETFFLREQGQLAFLRDTVLPGIPAGERNGPLRIWSAGCATGEEPYSIAMAVEEAAWPGTVAILGTDLAFARLVAAKRARYTAWSMRGVSDGVIARYFERQGKQFVLRPDIRRSVEFRVLNLASAEYPSLVSGVEQMDVIFCRNVLIYFDLATVAAIAARLMASLAPGGWLFLGASDPPIAEFVPCEVVLTGAGLAYRPPGTTSSEQRTPRQDVAPWTHTASIDQVDFDATFIPDVSSESTAVADAIAIESAHRPHRADSVANTHDSSQTAYDQADYEAAIHLARTAIDQGEGTDAVWIVLVRSYANRGDLEAAGIACSTALDRHRMSVEITHLHGILLAEAGRYVEAAEAARKALYLSPQYLIAHLALGDALARSGDVAHARRAFVNAETLLVGLAPDTPVPGGDGVEAGQLLRIARFRLETLGAKRQARPR